MHDRAALLKTMARAMADAECGRDCTDAEREAYRAREEGRLLALAAASLAALEAQGAAVVPAPRCGRLFNGRLLLDGRMVVAARAVLDDIDDGVFEAAFAAALAASPYRAEPQTSM